MNAQTLGVLLIIFSACGFATLAIFIKFAYAAGANTVTVLAYRFTIAALLFGAVIRLCGLDFRVTGKQAVQLCLLGGIGYGLMSTLFALTVLYLPASLAGIILYTYPALVSVLSFLVGDELFGWRKGVALVICFTGLVLVLGVSLTGLNTTGAAFGLGSALVYSCYIVAGNRLLKGIDPLVSTFYVCTAAAVVFVAGGMLSGTLIWSLSLQGWLAILGIAVFATCIGILGFFAGMYRIGATNASIISTFEPVITVLLSALLLEERITAIQGFGGLLILAGVLVLQLTGGSTAVAKTCDERGNMDKFGEI
ncbi:protein of unknown function DUF6, transmembrane [Thermosinus carboxydivorans Nor1]|uniref:EamA domain-containing protein n=1 Tax=Thermosinus carboxydivorans Nor1 TaxID=401526 RepID=A1HQZ7_9FIRM|nr:protein of unknown function DUF6, transmembrane [Thermosinus carboxydivorans Nor1]